MGGRVLHFYLAGINNQNFLMRDRETGTWWQQISGKAIFGKLKGETLELAPAPREDEREREKEKRQTAARRKAAAQKKGVPLGAPVSPTREGDGVRLAGSVGGRKVGRWLENGRLSPPHGVDGHRTHWCSVWCAWRSSWLCWISPS